MIKMPGAIQAQMEKFFNEEFPYQIRDLYKDEFISVFSWALECIGRPMVDWLYMTGKTTSYGETLHNIGFRNESDYLAFELKFK